MFTRRKFILGSGAAAVTLAGGSGLLLRKPIRAGAAPPRLTRTPTGELGPFYPVERPLDTDEDLTRVRGRGDRARGEIIEVTGRVRALDGTPQANARLEIWQANAVGRYVHAGDQRTEAPLDPAFQGYADIQADDQGVFRFLTVKPGAYPATPTVTRVPHIHLDVRGTHRRLITQMYFSDTDAAFLAQDRVLEHDLWGRTNPLPANIFARREPGGATFEPGATRYVFDIVL